MLSVLVEPFFSRRSRSLSPDLFVLRLTKTNGLAKSFFSVFFFLFFSEGSFPDPERLTWQETSRIVIRTPQDL